MNTTRGIGDTADPRTLASCGRSNLENVCRVPGDAFVGGDERQPLDLGLGEEESTSQDGAGPGEPDARRPE